MPYNNTFDYYYYTFDHKSTILQFLFFIANGKEHTRLHEDIQSSQQVRKYILQTAMSHPQSLIIGMIYGRQEQHESFYCRQLLGRKEK